MAREDDSRPDRSSGRAQGGLLLRQHLVQLADELPVAAHVLPERRPQALERGHVAVVRGRVQQRREELLPQINVPVPAIQRHWDDGPVARSVASRTAARVKEEEDRSAPFKRQFRSVFGASTNPGHLLDAHACPVQHHVHNDAEAVCVDLQAEESRALYQNQIAAFLGLLELTDESTGS